MISIFIALSHNIFYRLKFFFACTFLQNFFQREFVA